MSAVLLASMLMVVNPNPVGHTIAVQYAATAYYCRRTAGIALRVASNDADGDLANAAKLVRDFAGQDLRRRLQTDGDEREAGALGDRLTQQLVARYSRSHQREVLADALVNCAESL